MLAMNWMKPRNKARMVRESIFSWIHALTLTCGQPMKSQPSDKRLRRLKLFEMHYEHRITKMLLGWRLIRYYILVFIVSSYLEFFPQVFNSDIENLLKMGDMWRNRKPPTRLYFDEIRGGTFRLEMLQISNGSATNGKSKLKPPPKVLGPSGGLKDQKQLSLLDNLELFVSR